MAESFERWIPLRRLSLSDLPKYGACPAVYALRDASDGDTLKYGCAGSLRSRIVGNFLAGFGGNGPTSTTQRLHAQLFDKGMIERVEIAWIETQDRDEAERKETEFRAAYTAAHGRRPVWDLRD